MDSSSWLEGVLGVLTGLGLAAACGFRVFVPLFVAAIATRAGALQPAEGFAWIGSTPALLCLGSATALELAAYSVPWLDNALDALATPAAAVAGALVAATFAGELDAWLRWTLAATAGGGLALAVQLPSAALRAVSSASTGGLGNPVVAAGEAFGAGVGASLAIALPLLVPAALVALGVGAWMLLRARSAEAHERSHAP
jgi:hypothetical protein